MLVRPTRSVMALTTSDIDGHVAGLRFIAVIAAVLSKSMTHILFWFSNPFRPWAPPDPGAFFGSPSPDKVPLPCLDPAPWVPIPLYLVAPNLQHLSEENARALVLRSVQPRITHPPEPLARWLRSWVPGLE